MKGGNSKVTTKIKKRPCKVPGCNKMIAPQGMPRHLAVHKREEAIAVQKRNALAAILMEFTVNWTERERLVEQTVDRLIETAAA